MSAPSRPNCYACQHRRTIPGDAHSSCANRNACVDAARQGVTNGWFNWPWNFDPTWLIGCTGFEVSERKGGAA